jgi:hypothetical protein
MYINLEIFWCVAMQRTSSTLILFFCLATSLHLASPANASDAVCYSRYYNATHLAKHPDQIVTSMILALKPDRFHLSITVRGRHDALQAQGQCRDIRFGKRWCSLECDGGGIVVRDTKGRRSIIVELDRVRMSFYGEENLMTGVDIYGGIDDRSFRLDFCQEHQARDSDANLSVHFQDGITVFNTGAVNIFVNTFLINDRPECTVTVGKRLAPGEESRISAPVAGKGGVRACGRLSKCTITTDHGTFRFSNIIEAE